MGSKLLLLPGLHLTGHLRDDFWRMPLNLVIVVFKLDIRNLKWYRQWKNWREYIRTMWTLNNVRISSYGDAARSGEGFRKYLRQNNYGNFQTFKPLHHRHQDCCQKQMLANTPAGIYTFVVMTNAFQGSRILLWQSISWLLSSLRRLSLPFLPLNRIPTSKLCRTCYINGNGGEYQSGWLVIPMQEKFYLHV